MARIQTEDFDLSTEVAALLSGRQGVGGVVTFLGAVRDFSRGGAIEKLSFERYEGMAENELNRLEEETIQKFDLSGCRIIHRLGVLAPGDNIVLIVAAAPHRKEAFAACSWAIDELKKRIPIWKKEYGATGESWVEEHP